eukprot:15647501-Heterocapsa_arctica.AAC.1
MFCGAGGCEHMFVHGGGDNWSEKINSFAPCLKINSSCAVSKAALLGGRPQLCGQTDAFGCPQ